MVEIYRTRITPPDELERYRAEVEKQRQEMLKNFREIELKDKKQKVPYKPIAQPDGSTCFFSCCLGLKRGTRIFTDNFARRFYQEARERGVLTRGAETTQEDKLGNLQKFLQEWKFKLDKVYNPYKPSPHDVGILQNQPYEAWPQLIFNNIDKQTSRICLLNYPIISPDERQSINHWVALYGYEKLNDRSVIFNVGNPLGGKEELWTDAKLAQKASQIRTKGFSEMQLAILSTDDK